MLYLSKLKKATFIFVVSCFLTSGIALSNSNISLKYSKWKEAITNPKDSKKVFAFFYNNPHWPLFEDSVREAEKNITGDVSDGMLLKWFKRYQPKTSEGLKTYINRLIKDEPDFADSYIKKTWIFQNLSPKFMDEYRTRFEDHVSSVEDAQKARILMKSIKIDQLLALKDIVIEEISDFISTFLEKHFTSKSGGYSKKDLDDIDKKYEIIQKLIDAKKDEKAANILIVSNKNEEKYAVSFFNQRRHIAYNVLRQGNPQLAYNVMSKYKLDGKKNEKIAKAEWLLGYLSFRFLKNNKKAIEHFIKAYENSINSIRLSKNAFWIAETYKTNGDIVLALSWYKKSARYFSTFYGYIAEERLKGLPNISKNKIASWFSSDPEYELSYSPTVAFNFYNRELVQVLLKINDKKTRKYFYRQLIDEITDPAEEVLLMDIASANDEISILISENSKRQHYFSNDKAYKMLERTNIKVIEKINASPCFVSLVHSIIQRESNFNEKAKSAVGAIGLMQIMPSTANYEVKISKIKKGDLFNKQYNIKIGSLLLNRLLNKYNKNLIYAIAAYNCGEGAVSKYLKSIQNLDNLDPIDIIELIPIKETRLYVKHVIRAMMSYQKRFSLGTCYNCDAILKTPFH